MKRWILPLTCAAVLSPAVARPAHAEEVHITGPLAGASAVMRMRIYREGRIQLQPFVGFTLQDEFSRTLLAGGQATYHLTDWLGIGVWGGFGAIHIDTGLTDEVVARGQSTDRNRLSLPSREAFADQIGLIKWAAAAQVSFIPLRGKLALFQEVFVDADFYLFLGAAAVGVEERAETPENECAVESPACFDSQVARASRVAVAPTFGAGLMLYATDLVGISFEWRGLPFSWNTSGTDEGSPWDEFPDNVIDSEDQIFHMNHMVNLGVAFYLPAAAKISE